MIREIKKKIIILTGRMPFAPDRKRYISELEKIDWIYENLRLEGSVLTKEQAALFVKGEILINIPVGEHVQANRLIELLDALYELSEHAQRDVEKLVFKIHSIISDETKEELYRKRSLIIPELNYEPALPADIPTKMNEFALFYRESIKAQPLSEEFFDRAAQIHNKLIEIMPFGGEDKLLARAMMTMYFLTMGYPAICPNAKEEEYNEVVENCLKTRNFNDFKELLKKETLVRLDRMIQLTSY